ncbi:MAG: DUF3667 domain-containing protein [Flavobacterium sp.]|nr:MAG: DUF3667 domain-containing protein [Flavobacterium sp.]
MATTCKNCGNVFEGNYCNNCGQPAKTHSIGASFIAHDLQHGLFHYDMGLLYSARELFKRPGHTTREYIEGKRVRHYKPISMLIVVASLYGLLYHALHIDVFEGQKSDMLDYSQLNDWIAHHYSMITLLLLPVMSLTSFVIFKKQGYNFTEHFILNSFYSTQKLWIRIITLPILYFISAGKPIVMQCLLIVDLLLMFWCYSEFFVNISRLKVLALSVAATLINLFLVLVITTLLFAAIYH